jgi:hypothetical protein
MRLPRGIAFHLLQSRTVIGRNTRAVGGRSDTHSVDPPFHGRPRPWFYAWGGDKGRLPADEPAEGG